MSSLDLENIKVGVLGGGVSLEREISLISARAVFQSLERKKNPAVYIDIYTSKEEEVKKTILSHNIDAAFIALHGEFGEDGSLQKILEELDIPYTGSGPKASYQAMDKIVSKEIFFREDIPTAAYCVLQEDKGLLPYQYIGDRGGLENIKYPVVVKPYLGGSSIGVSIVEENRQLDRAVKKALSLQNRVVLEEYIDGREFTVGILEEKPLGVIEIIPKTGYFDFNAKYNDGLTELKAAIDLPRDVYKKIQEVGLKAHDALGCRHFSRVDIRLDKKNQPYVLEVNSIPGLTSHSLLPFSAKCCGISFDDMILEMVRLALNEKIQAKKI